MFEPLALRVIWNNQKPVTPYMGFRDLFVNPEPEFPFGRKGLALISAWEQIGIPNQCIGLIILDGDVAIDPHDVRMMHSVLWNDPECVWVAPHKIWPVSHQREGWTWGHGKEEFTQEDVDDPDVFSFCFTYLPAKLVNMMVEVDASEWCYPEVDFLTHRLAKAEGIKVCVARDCQPKHMHW